VALTRLHNDDFGYSSNCFVCEQTNDLGLRIPFFHDTVRQVVTADFRLSNTYSGAPTMVHGGVLLAVLDEAMAWACIAIARQWAVTTETSTSFRRAVLVDVRHTVEAEIVDTAETDTEIVTIGRILDTTGAVCAAARATFTALGEAQLKKAAGETGDHLHESVKLD